MTCLTRLIFLLISIAETYAFVHTAFRPHSWSSSDGGIKAASSNEEHSARPAINWFKQETLESLLPKEDALAIISELLSDDALIDDSEILVKRNWESFEKRLQEETRSCSDILGEESTERILNAVQSLDSYDPQSVRAFLSSDAVNNLFGKILYDGIFEFFQKIDVFGNIVNSLPIIGPIRKQIVSETKRQLDRSLGPLVQSFLGQYTKIAVAQASDYILSPSNQKAFGTANVRLVSNILDRPINTLLPPSDLSENLRVKTFDYVRSIESEEINQYVDFIYDFVGNKTVDRFVDVDRILEASPTLQKSIDSIWTRATDA